MNPKNIGMTSISSLNLDFRLFNSVDIEVSAFNLNLKYIYVNPVTVNDQKLRKWIIGKTVLEYAKKVSDKLIIDHEKRKRWMELALEDEIMTEFEEEIILSNGSKKFYSRKISPFFDTNGILSGLICYGIDITDRKLAEREIYRQKSFLNDLIDNEVIGIYTFDNEFRYQEWNIGMERISGYSKKDVIGRVAYDLFPKIKNIGILDKYELALTGKSILVNEESFFFDEPGYFNAFYTPMKNNEGESIGGLVIFQDISKLKLTEEELILSESRYKLFFEQSNEAIFITSIDGDLISVNNTLRKLLGYSQDEVIDKKSIDFYVNSIDLKNLTAELEKNHHIVDYEVQLKKRDGTIMDCLITSSIQYDHNSNHIGYQGMIRDITQEKITQEQLKILSSTVEESPSTVIITDKLGDITYVNPKFCEITGYSKEEVIGKNPRILKSGSTSKEEYKEIWKTLSKGSTWSGYFKNKKKNNEIYWAYASISSLKNDQGDITHYIGIQEDQTERIENEIALQASEERFRTIFDKASIGFALVDDFGRIVQTNSTFRGYIGFSEKELQSKNFFAYIHENDNFDHASIKSILEENKPQEFLFEKKDGDFIWTKSTFKKMSQLMNDDQDYYLILVEDITDKRRMEIEKEKLQEQLSHSQKLDAIGQLAGGIAHDFNNLLAGIIGNADLLAISLKDSEKIELVNQILVASERAADLNQKLLAFARKSKQDLRPVNVNSSISEVIEILRRTIDKRISIVKKYKSRKLVVMGDISQLHNIILNLALNARDAMPSGGNLEFSTLRVDLDEEFCQSQIPKILPGKYVEIKITDNGSGMNEMTKSKIFEPFFTTKSGKGVGLGLASVYGYVISHSGAVQVESEENFGTTFTIYLPLSFAKIKDTPKVKVKEKADKKVIMLVDDEEILLNVVSKVLTQLGHEVMIFMDGISAITEYEINYKSIDLVLLDINMPIIDGWGVYERMKVINSNVNVLFYSGYLELDMDKYKDDKNIIGYLKKPFRRNELINLINKI